MSCSATTAARSPARLASRVACARDLGVIAFDRTARVREVSRQPGRARPRRAAQPGRLMLPLSDCYHARDVAMLDGFAAATVSVARFPLCGRHHW